MNDKDLQPTVRPTEIERAVNDPGLRTYRPVQLCQGCGTQGTDEQPLIPTPYGPTHPDCDNAW